MGDTSRSNWIFEIPIPFVWRALMARHRCSALMRSQACPASFLRKHWKSGAPCYQLNKEMHLTCSYISLWGCPRAHHTNIRMRTHISRERCCQATRSSPPPHRLFFSLHLCFLWLLSKVKRRERIKQKQYFPFLLSMWKYVLSYNVLMLFILYCHYTYYLLLFFFLNMPISKPAQICC